MEQTVETSVSLDDQGRILIPPVLKQRLGLSPGMRLVVEPGEKDSVCLRLESNLPHIVDKGGVLVVRQISPDQSADWTSDLMDITRKERNRRMSALLKRVTA